jgi:hypothetical protein
MRHPVLRTLLAAAKRQKLDATLLAGTGKLDYSSCNRLLQGKATRPSFEMILGLATATGFKVKLVRGRRPKPVKLKRSNYKPKRKSKRGKKAGRRRKG